MTQRSASTDPATAARQGRRLRILALSIYYPPEPGANARIVSELASEWRRMGHDVTVLTDIPHYPDDVVPDDYKGGRRREENIDGVRVIRCPLIIRDRASTVGRLLNNISFALSAVWRARRAGRADVIYVYSPPIFLGIGAWLIKLFKRAPVVFNVQDIYPDVAIAHGFLTNPALIRAFKAFEKWVYNRSTRVTVISEGFRGNLLEKGVADRKIDIIPNCVDAEQFRPAPRDNEFRRELDVGDRFVVLYGGNLGHAQGLETVIEAAKLLEPKRSDVEFVIVGDGVEGDKLRKLHQKVGAKNLRFIGPVPRARMPEIVSAADACLVILRARKSTIWIQSKTYEIMSAARPIIASIDEEGDNWRLIAEAGGGIHATPGDPKALADTVEKLADDATLRRSLAESGRRHIEENYTLPRIAGLYVDSMRRAVEDRGASRPAAADQGPEPTRITIINQFYPPDLSPTAHLAAALAENRAQRGDTVTVVASKHGYVLPLGAAPPSTAPNLVIHRVWTPGLGKATFFKRFLDYTAFYLLAAWKLVTLPAQDVIVALTTPPCIGWTAVLHRMLHPRTRLILWNMDCYPDVAERSDAIRRNGLLARFMRSRNKSIFRRLDHLVCLDHAMARHICAQHARHNPTLPVTVIPNWERADFFPAGERPEPWTPPSSVDIDGKFVILYLGNAGYGHQFETVIDAAEQLKDDGVAFLFVGGGSRWPALRRARNERGLTNIILHDYIPKEQTPSVMAVADCALTTLRDNMLGMMSPSKTHSNMAMGLPVVYVGPAGSNVDEAITQYDCGVSLRHGDTQTLVDFVRRVRQDPARLEQLSRNARRAFEEAYCDTVCMPRFNAVIDHVMGEAQPQHETPRPTASSIAAPEAA